ncbi:PorV/PorQ family protein [bacterium]|nr:PorV/PorQ family protein [bacterium]
MKATIYSTMIFAFCASILFASENSSFEFLKTSFGARAAAMGGAFAGAQQDLISIGYNPAGLLGIKSKKAAFSYLDYFADFKGGFTAYGQQLSNDRSVAFSISYMSYGTIERTDVTGRSSGSFTPGDFLVSAAYAAKSDMGIRYGITAKFIQSQIDRYKANALAVDAGLLYRIETQQMNVGISINNLGQAMSAYHQTKENLPLAYRAGLSKTLAHLPLTLQFQFMRYQFQESDIFGGLYWALGGEFQLSQVTFLRWGYNSVGNEQKADSDIDRFSGISFGFGTQFQRFVIDYAFSYHGILGGTNQFTIQMIL